MRHLLAPALALLLIACDDSAPSATSSAISIPTATVGLVAAPSPTPTAITVAPTATSLPSSAVEVTLPAARDTTLFESDTGDVSNGAGDALFVGRNRGGRAARALAYIDVAAMVPSGATILEARLVLRSSRAATGDAVVSLHPVLAPWGEAGSAARRGEGQGAPAQPGDATWTHRLYPDTPWSTPGGEVGETIAEVRFQEQVASYTWGPNEALTQQVQAWLDAPESNHGLLLRTAEEPERVTAVRFYSREGGVSGAGPALVLVYTLP